MRELCGWIFFSVNRLKFMYIVSCRLILRHHGTERSDWSLRRGKILFFLRVSVFKLFDWYLSGINWLHGMHDMSRRLILRDN